MKMIEFCLSEDPMGVHAVEKQLGTLRKQLANGEFNDSGVPQSGNFLNSIAFRQDVESDGWAAFAGYASNIIFRDEIQSIRSQTGQSVEEIRNELVDPEKTKKATIFAYDEHGEVALRISRWIFDSVSGSLEAIKNNSSIIIGWGKVYKNRPGALQIKNIWVLEED